MPEKSVSNYAPNPFAEPSLTLAEASAFCGIAAALAFAIRYGEYPSIDEAKKMAKRLGWTPENGMAGPQSEKRLLEAFGIPCYYKEGEIAESELADQVKSGDPVIVSTSGHYFVVDDYDPQRRLFHVGNTGTTLKAGSDWMSYDDMGSAVGGQGINAMLVPRPPADYLGGGGTAAKAGASAGGSLGARGAAEAAQNRDQNIQVYNTEIERLTKLKDDPLQTDPKTGQVSGGSQAMYDDANRRYAEAKARVAAINAELKTIIPYGTPEEMEQAKARQATLQNDLYVATQAQNEAYGDAKVAQQTLEDHKNQIVKMEQAKTAAQMITSRSLDDYAKQLTLDVAQGRLDSEVAGKLLQAQFDKAGQGIQGLTAAYSALDKMAPRMATKSLLDATVASLRGWNKFLPAESQIPEFSLPFIPMGNILEEFQKYLPPKPDWETEQQAERALKGIYGGGKEGADRVAGLFSGRERTEAKTAAGTFATPEDLVEGLANPKPAIPGVSGGQGAVTGGAIKPGQVIVLRSEPKMEASKITVTAGPGNPTGRTQTVGTVLWSEVEMTDGTRGWTYEVVGAIEAADTDPAASMGGPTVGQSAERESIMRGESSGAASAGAFNPNLIRPRPPFFPGPGSPAQAQATPTVPPSGTQAAPESTPTPGATPATASITPDQRIRLADYLYRANEAKKKGEPIPKPDPDLDPFLAEIGGP